MILSILSTGRVEFFVKFWAALPESPDWMQDVCRTLDAAVLLWKDQSKRPKKTGKVKATGKKLNLNFVRR